MKALRLRQRFWRFWPAITIATVVALLWNIVLFQDQPMAKESSEKPFPQFILTDVLSDKVIKNSDLKGKTHVVHIWASWCGACIKEHGALMKLVENHPVSMVGVIYRDEPEKALTILKKKGNPFKYLLNDKGGRLGKSLGILGTPETFVIDPSGTIRFHVSGAMDKETIDEELVPVLEKIAHE